MKKNSMYLFLLTVLFLSSSLKTAPTADKEDFELLMGKNTAHWQHITQNEEIVFLEKCKHLYNKNQGLKEMFSSLSKIPKVVHFIWLGPRPFPPGSVENVRTWIAKHPDWQFVFWTDHKRPPPCSSMQTRQVRDFAFQKLERCYKQSENWGEKSDILRYEILSQMGGVYVDHDANCLQSFEGLHKAYDFYCGLETPHTPFVGKNVTCGNGVIGSRPHHPTIEKVIDLIDSRWDQLGQFFRGKDHFSKEELVMQRTYIALTDALTDTLEKEGNKDIVFPASYFFAKNGLKSLYSKHFFANAWAEDSLKKTQFEEALSSKIIKLKHESKHLMAHFFGLFGLSLISIVMLLVLFLKAKKRYFS